MGGPNPLITLLASYCPSPENEAAYDETIQMTVQRTGVEPPQIEHPLWGDLRDLLAQSEPPSIVLTGTAGDGKTHLCRQLYMELGGRGWGKPIVRTRLRAGQTLVIVKDFTELGESAKADIVGRMAAAVYGSDRSEVFLVAANEGILTRKTDWHSFPNTYRSVVERYAQKKWVFDLHKDLRDYLQRAGGRPSSQRLRVFDLSRIPAVANLQSVLSAVLDHGAWELCSQCPGSRSDSLDRCPVFENRRRLKEQMVQERLHALVELAEYNGEHLTMRHLLMLVANAIVGHGGVKGPVKAIRHCDQTGELSDNDRVQGAYFQNVFGANLARAEKVNPFSLMASFGVGHETNNRVDRLLVYGDLEPKRSQWYNRLMSADPYFGETQTFSASRESYREAPPGPGQERFLDHLIAQRRRLYFEMPQEAAAELGHEDLLVFRSASEYRDRILMPLRKGQRVREQYLQPLVIGVNRVFVGALLSVNDKVLLATSGTTSQSRRCDLLINALAHNPIERVGVAIEMDENHRTNAIPWLVVCDHSRELARLRLTVSRYEFLTRVAEGVLPGSFSPELYEDMLAFKAQLIREFLGHIQVTDLPLRVIHPKDDGGVRIDTVEVGGDRFHD